MTRKRARPTGGHSDTFVVVGVGASAGGFDPFCEMLEGLPQNPDFAIVLVQHLAPQHSSALPELLAGHSKVPVMKVTEGVRIEPGHVYIIPPNAQMEVVRDHLHLTPRPDDRSQ